MDKKTLEFVTYCIGKLSVLLNLPQNEIYKRLKTSGILYDYIVPSYDVLHTFSSRYLMEDLTEYMREKGVLSDKTTDVYYNSETANLIKEGEKRNIKESDYPLTIRTFQAGDKTMISDYQVLVRRLFIDWKMPPEPMSVVFFLRNIVSTDLYTGSALESLP